MRSALYICGRFLRALVQWPFAEAEVKNPRLIMTLLVKNEEEKLEANLQFHHAMGVDGFIITDNGSTDKTRDIIQHYCQKGWIVEVVNEPSTGYEQKRWVDRMISLARKRHKADWVINADADELWYAPSGSLKAELGKWRKRVVRCRVFSIYPEDGVPFYQWTRRISPVTNPADYDLSPYSIFNQQNFKVGHRTMGYLHISMGNHKVKMWPPTKGISDIVVFHYNIGNREQFVRKMVQGGRELEQHSGRHGGRHWRYFYQLYKEGRLEAEYDRVIGRNQFDRLVDDGHIVEDRRIVDFFDDINLTAYE